MAALLSMLHNVLFLGDNIAINLQTKQTCTKQLQHAWLAVDGDPDTYAEHCAQDGYWYLDLERSLKVRVLRVKVDIDIGK